MKSIQGGLKGIPGQAQRDKCRDKSCQKENGNLTKRIKLSGNDSITTLKKPDWKTGQELEPNRDEIEQKLALSTEWNMLRDAKKVIKEIKDRKRIDYKSTGKRLHRWSQRAYSCPWKNVFKLHDYAYVADYQRGIF